MDDLFGAYLPKESRPVQTLTHQKSLDLLSFDSPSSHRPTPTKSTRRTKDVSHFVKSSPVAQWKEASPLSKQRPFDRETRNTDAPDDEFGDFQSNLDEQATSQASMKTETSTTVSLPGVGDSRDLGRVDDDDDDFGDFVDSPLPTHDAFLADTMPPSHSIDVPGPAVLLKFLLEHILQVPTRFITELATVSYSLRKVVLSNQRTKSWLRAILEGAAIAQRVIRGRNRRVKDTQRRREAQIASDRLAEHWKEMLMPRLSSLAGGAMTFRPMKTNALNDNYSEGKVCHVCKTEDDSATLLRSIDAGMHHKGCMALLGAFKAYSQ